MGRFHRRLRSDRQDRQDRQTDNPERLRNNYRREKYSGQTSFYARGAIHKRYRNDRAATSQTRTGTRGGFTDRRQPSGGKRGGKRYVQNGRAATAEGTDNVVKRERQDIRTILAGSQTKDACEISLILGAKLEKVKEYLKQATENESRLKRCLNALDKAFQSETTPALMLNVINAMMETAFVLNTVDMLKINAKGKQSIVEDISYQEAICALLRIMIRVCALNPSAITFIFGSYNVIKELLGTIRDSVIPVQLKKDLTSTYISSQCNKTTEPTDSENKMDTDNDCLQKVCISENREGEVVNCHHDSTNAYLKDRANSQKRNILPEGPTCLGDINPCLAYLEQLFSELDDNVKLCTIQRRRKKQPELIDYEENSNENFRDIPIFPRLGDLNGDIKPHLRVNKAKGAYRSVDDYLDVQFRLLREDFVEPLREGIRAFTGQMFGRNKKRIREIKVYENTQIESVFCGDGLNHVLSFDISKLKHVPWNMTKRLKYGSLVCLSADNFQTCYFATIVDSEVKFRRQGRLHVKFAHGPKQIQVLMGSTFTMVESTAYFESYRPILSSLLTITENDLPFQEYIIRCENNILPPKYILRTEKAKIFDLRCLLDPDVTDCHEGILYQDEIFRERSSCLKTVNILKSKWPMEDQLHLDSSQLKALKTALTREFSVIQGPPGCGKTHLGLKIAKVLLNNKNVWRHENGTRAQMLVVCYTNHALDQFMEGICSFFNGNLVRVGGRSKSEAMSKYNFKSIKRFFRQTKAQEHYLRCGSISIFSEVKAIENELNLESEKIKILRQNIVHENSLCKEMDSYHYKQFTWLKVETRSQGLPPWLAYLGYSSMVEWLGIFKLAKEIHDNMNNSYQTEDTDRGIKKILDKEIISDNREAMSDIDFDFNKRLAEWQNEELDVFKREHICLDFDKVKTFKGDILSETERRKANLERKELTKKVRHLMQEIKPMSESEVLSVGDIFSTNFTNRWAMYLHWVQKMCNRMNIDNENKLEQYQEAQERKQEVVMMEERSIFREADIIGMTITGAAKHKTVLREIKPTIMIVEEAAEVLESHLVSNLTSGCEQLIMIGDHKQLKPKPNVYRLEREYNLDLSLFERMVRNDIRCDCLQIQHRMRTEIADNVRSIYGTLIDHQSVKQYNSVKGIAHNMYFIDRINEEKKDDELKSFTNLHEAKYLIALCRYLLLQGYNTSAITILTTYKGQMYMMKKEVLKQGNLLKDVQINIVDNYQGEENDIILLSLVRSNREGRIGFLARNNRVCVALSRAKIGFYVIGDFTCLSSVTELWNRIITDTRRKGLIGKALPLRCQNHPEDKGIMAENPVDFYSAPEGGCRKLCDIRLDCGHACGIHCHIKNREHTGITCRKPCARQCKNGHECKKMCSEECHCEEAIIITLPNCGHTVSVRCSIDLESFICDRVCNKLLNCGHVCTRMCRDVCVCMEPVEVKLPCGHDATIPCSINPEKHKCNKSVQVLLADCGHLKQILCRDTSKSKICRSVCKLPLDCGHICMEICGDITNGFKHITDNDRTYSKCPKGHTTYCKNPCETSLKCGHACKGTCSTCFKGRWHKLCAEECNCNLICGHYCKGKCGYCLPCTEKCTRRCSHNLCRKACMEVCVPCTRKCSWECKHFVCNKPCGEICDRRRCNKPCKKVLPCKHQCIGMCGDPCPTLCRVCNKENVAAMQFGSDNLPNSRFVQLQDCGHLIKYDIMDEYMDIEEDTCLKRCPLCKKPIHTTNGNRYERIVNIIYLKINNVKHLTLQDCALRRILMASASKQNERFKNGEVSGFTAFPSANYDLATFFRKLQAPPSILFNFLACRDIVNTLNQLAIYSFVKSVSKQNAYTMENESLFPGASFCLFSSQHSYEIERELMRFLDTRQLEKIGGSFLAHQSCNKEIREIIENANKILVQDGKYSEENRTKVQKCMNTLPENEKCNKQLLDLSVTTVDIDRGVIIKNGYMDIAYRFKELSQQNKANAIHSQCLDIKSEVMEHGFSEKKITKEQLYVADTIEQDTTKELHADEHKIDICLTNDSESTDTHIEQACNDTITTTDDKKKNKDGITLQLKNEEIEDGEICENEISEVDKTNPDDTIQDSYLNDVRCYLDDLEDGEILDEWDIQQEVPKLSNIQKTFKKQEDDIDVFAMDKEDERGIQEDTIACTGNKYPGGKLTELTECSSCKNNDSSKDTFSEENEYSLKIPSQSGHMKTSYSEEQTHVIKLFKWPGVPYFQSEQTVFCMKSIQETDRRKHNEKGAKRSAAGENRIKQAKKKAKTGTGTKTHIYTLNSKKRLNNETGETEPSKKKVKPAGKVSFKIPTKHKQKIIHNEHFESDIEEEREQDRNSAPYKTDIRKVSIKSNKYIGNTHAAQGQHTKPGKGKTSGDPFIIQKISWLKSPVATASTIRKLVDYDDIDMNEDNHNDFGSFYCQNSNSEDRTTETGRIKIHRQMQEHRMKSVAGINKPSECNMSSKRDESTSSPAKMIKDSFHLDHHNKERNRHNAQIEGRDLRNMIDNKKHYYPETKISASNVTDKIDRRDLKGQIRDKTKRKCIPRHSYNKRKQSKKLDRTRPNTADISEERTLKGSKDLRRFLNEKSGKGSHQTLETDAEIEIEGEAWRVLDTA